MQSSGATTAPSDFSSDFYSRVRALGQEAGRGQDPARRAGDRLIGRQPTHSSSAVRHCRLYTDDHGGYEDLMENYRHRTVCHASGEYANRQTPRPTHTALSRSDRAPSAPTSAPTTWWSTRHLRRYVEAATGPAQTAAAIDARSHGRNLARDGGEAALPGLGRVMSALDRSAH